MPAHADFAFRVVDDARGERRRERQISWPVVASEVASMPRVMRLVRWLGRLAVTFTTVADW